MTGKKNPTFDITLFSKRDPKDTQRASTLSKTIFMDEDGKIKSNSEACKLIVGIAGVQRLNGVNDLAKLLNKLAPQHALSIGSYVQGDKVWPQDQINIISWAPDASDPKQDGLVQRIGDNFKFPSGQPGYMFWDYDTKKMPAHVKALIDQQGGPVEALHNIIPALAKTAVVVRTSTSGAVRSIETGELVGTSGGFHRYPAVVDVSDVPRATKALHDHAWLHGLGWIMVSESGQLLERSIVDKSVASAERLIFEGAPILGPGLEYDETMRKAVAIEGDILDTAKMIPSLSSRQLAEKRALVAKAKKELAPEAEKARMKFVERMAKDISEKRGVGHQEACRIVNRMFSGVLAADVTINFDRAGDVLARDVLANPSKYVGETSRDPREPEYGACKAKLYEGPHGTLFLNALSHGISAQMRLTHDVLSLTAMLDAVDGDMRSPDLRRFAFAVANSQIDEFDLDDLIARIMAMSPPEGTTARSLKSSIKAAKHDLSNATAGRGDNDDENMDDMRPDIDVGIAGGPLLPPMREIDAALCAIDGEIDPPLRNLSGSYVIARKEKATRILGQQDDADEDEAPFFTTLHVANDSDVCVDLENFILPYRLKGDRILEVQVPLAIARAYSTWQESNLPRVSGVTTLPYIARNGDFVCENGLNTAHDTLVDIEPEVIRALPEGDIDEQRVGAAYRFLRDEWLVDVLGKDAAAFGGVIAIALSIIQRNSYTEAPVWGVNAFGRGTGKTTTVNMIHTGLFGCSAPATAWAQENIEERRKAIFAMLLKGAPVAAFDNIENGSSITCAVVARAVTSEYMNDRVLGRSEEQRALASTVMIFTANNFSFGKDMASRSFTCLAPIFCATNFRFIY